MHFCKCKSCSRKLHRKCYRKERNTKLIISHSELGSILIDFFVSCVQLDHLKFATPHLHRNPPSHPIYHYPLLLHECNKVSVRGSRILWIRFSTSIGLTLQLMKLRLKLSQKFRLQHALLLTLLVTLRLLHPSLLIIPLLSHHLLIIL